MKEPLITLGKRFASPIKRKGPRAKRAKARKFARPVTELSIPQSPPSEEGPSECGEGTNTPTLPVESQEVPSQSTEVMVNIALLARIEFLEAENTLLKASPSKPQYFRIAQIQHNDPHFHFYTGFTSNAIFLAFFEFLGPVVLGLNYWGLKEQPHQRRHIYKLDPMN